MERGSGSVPNTVDDDASNRLPTANSNEASPESDNEIQEATAASATETDPSSIDDSLDELSCPLSSKSCASLPVERDLSSSSGTSVLHGKGLVHSFWEQPIQASQKMEHHVLFCLVLFTIVIWMIRREKRRQDQRTTDQDPNVMLLVPNGGGGRRGRTESNMSSSLDDTSSIRSLTNIRRGRGRLPSKEYHPLTGGRSKWSSDKTIHKHQSNMNLNGAATRGLGGHDRFPILHWAREEEGEREDTDDLHSLDRHRQQPMVEPQQQQPHLGLPSLSSTQGYGTWTSQHAISYHMLQPQQQPQQQHHLHHLECAAILYGPHTSSMVYHTWTPPPPWAEAARRVFPRDVNSLRRTLKVNLLHRPPTLTISDGAGESSSSPSSKRGSSSLTGSQDDVMAHSPKATRGGGAGDAHEFCLHVTEFSVHPTPPTEGVLEVYVKNSPKSEWMENTFQSAQAAAQFQTDLLATQLMGTTIQNMYHVFRLIHQGSLAHDGPECVLHDDNVNQYGEAKDHCIAVGVAWDDVMRCFGSTFPGIRRHLEELWWNETKPHRKTSPSDEATTATNTGATTNTGQGKPSSGPSSDPQTQQPPNDAGNASSDDGVAGFSSEYISKRVLLGPVDFFRLFVPIMPVDAIPYTTSDIERMQHLLQWRKRVARASLLVQSYARARQLVNIGWRLGFDKPPDGYWKFRLAYDMNIDNQARDRTAKNEYYEPYVSRDIFCRVRGIKFPDRKWWSWTSQVGESVFSLGQTFSLVGSHMFNLPAEGDARINVYTDPVQSIPSLRELVENNPDVDFFVKAMHIKTIGVVNVSVFARNMPVGVDPSFDTVWERFKGGDEAFRQQRLEFLLQLDLTTFRFPLLQALFMHLMTILLWLLDYKGFVTQSSSVSPSYYTFSDRYALPAMKAEYFGSCHHFGGALVDGRHSPTNYVAVNCNVDPQRWCTLAGRLVITFITANNLAREVADLSVKIRGEDESELPERILCAYRFVQVSHYQIALTTQCAFYSGHRISQLTLSNPNAEIPGKLNVLARGLLLDPCVAVARACAEAVGISNTEALQQTVVDSFHDEPLNENYSGRKPQLIATSEPFDLAVNKLIELLADVRIPIRDDVQLGAVLTHGRTGTRPVVPLGSAPSAQEALEVRRDLRQVSILRVVNRNDLLRFFVASNCSLKKATVRIVESAAWRGLTFPIDARTCRVELQTGQFFQQGRDLGGRPVFYFRQMLKGPWRGDEDAVIAAVVHRLEQSMVHYAREDPDVRCTLIVLTGKPQKKKSATDITNAGSVASQESFEESAAQQDSVGADDLDTNGEEEDHFEEFPAEDIQIMAPKGAENFDNPRVPESEKYYVHSNDPMLKRLIKLVMLHYPERLYRALVVKGHGAPRGGRTALGGMIALSGFVGSANTRRKVKFIRKCTDLQKYVDKKELIHLAGGDADISPAAFEIN